jgi:hypothetical protein
VPNCKTPHFCCSLVLARVLHLYVPARG